MDKRKIFEAISIFQCWLATISERIIISFNWHFKFGVINILYITILCQFQILFWILAAFSFQNDIFVSLKSFFWFQMIIFLYYFLHFFYCFDNFFFRFKNFHFLWFWVRIVWVINFSFNNNWRIYNSLFFDTITQQSCHFCLICFGVFLSLIQILAFWARFHLFKLRLHLNKVFIRILSLRPLKSKIIILNFKIRLLVVWLTLITHVKALEI